MDRTFEQIGARYRAWAQDARERCPLYEDLANAVADDRFTLEFLSRLPEPKQQPNLLFGAVKYGWGAQPDWKSFRRLVEAHQDPIRQIILKRRTQTNEPARCATLLPFLALLPQPLALLEVGAAAGLCLIPDRYAYVYNGSARVPAAKSFGVPPPTFACQANRGTPIPERHIEVAWRAGLDLEPVDVRDADSMRWLEALVWPGEGDRLELLRQAVEVARHDPPPVHRGDLRKDLTALAATAPRQATLVIFHSAVLLYVPSSEEREALGRNIADLGAVWISNEPLGMSVRDLSRAMPQGASGEILIAMNRAPMAWADSHGAWLRWFASHGEVPPIR